KACEIVYHSHRATILDPGGADDADSPRNLAVKLVACSNDCTPLHRRSNVFVTDHNPDFALGAIAIETFVEDFYQTLFFFECLQQFAQTLAVRKLGLGEDIKRALDKDLSSRTVFVIQTSFAQE